MTGWTALALGMAVAAAVAGVPGLLLLAFATFGYGATTRLWTRYGLLDLAYDRRLSTGRTVVGDTVDLDVAVWNRKALPLPWIAADDLVTDGIEVRERPLDLDDVAVRRRSLRNTWALGWYERVIRHFHLEDRRPDRLLIAREQEDRHLHRRAPSASRTAAARSATISSTCRTRARIPACTSRNRSQALNPGVWTMAWSRSTRT